MSQQQLNDFNSRVASSTLTAEQSIIGSMIIDNSCISKILSEVNHEAFTTNSHRLLFKAIKKLASLNTPVDLITLSDEIEVQGHGESISLSYIADIAKETPSAANVMAYVEIIKKNDSTRKVDLAHQDFMQGGITHGEYIMLHQKYFESAEINKTLSIKENSKEQDDFYNGPVETKELIFDNCLPMGEVGMLTGAGGSGKSFATIHLAVSVALGVPAFIGYDRPFRPIKAGKVVILGGEDFRDDYKRRVRSVLSVMECDTQNNKNRLVENLHIISLVGEDIRIIKEDKFGASITGVVDNIAREVESLGDVRLVILDPMSAFYGAQENDNHSATMFVNAVTRICKKTGAAVLMVHHSTKGSAGSSRGASGFIDRCRTHLSLKTIAQIRETKRARKDKPITEDDKNTIVVDLVKSNHVRFWECPIYLKRTEKGSFNAIKPTNYEPTIYERDSFFRWELDLIDYLGRDGTPISKNEIEQNKDSIFYDNITQSEARKVMNQALENGRVLLTKRGLILA